MFVSINIYLFIKWFISNIFIYRLNQFFLLILIFINLFVNFNVLGLMKHEGFRKRVPWYCKRSCKPKKGKLCFCNRYIQCLVAFGFLLFHYLCSKTHIYWDYFFVIGWLHIGLKYIGLSTISASVLSEIFNWNGDAGLDCIGGIESTMKITFSVPNCPQILLRYFSSNYTSSIVKIGISHACGEQRSANWRTSLVF